MDTFAVFFVGDLGDPKSSQQTEFKKSKVDYG